MLSHEMICEAVDAVAKTFAVKQVSYFGSYAEGRATDDSDLDVIHAPIPETSLIKPTKVVQVYAA